MDPISAPASILTVLGAAMGTCKILYASILDMKDAPNDIQVHSRKLQNLHETLRLLLEACSRLPEDYRINTSLYGIDDFVQELASIRSRVEKRAKSSTSDSVSRVKESYRWLLFDRQLTKFFTNLEHYNMIISNAFWTVQFSMLNQIVQQTVPVEQIRREMAHLPDLIPVKSVSDEAYLLKDSKAFTVPYTTPRMERMFSYFAQVMEPAGLILKNHRLIDIGSTLRIDYKRGAAITRRWTLDGNCSYDPNGHSISLNVQTSYFISIRMTIALFILRKLSQAFRFDVRCNIQLSCLIPWDDSNVSAIRVGDINHIRHSLVTGTLHMNSTTSDGCTYLHLATQHGRADIISLLLENGADVNAANDRGDTSLHVSVKQDVDLECSRRLLSRGGDLCLPNNSGRTALHTLYSSVSAYIFQHYADQIDVWAQDGDGMTVLHYIAWTNQSSSKDLLRQIARPSPFTAYRCLEKTVSPLSIKDAQGKSVLHYAAQRGNQDLIQSLSQRPDSDGLCLPDHTGSTILHYATESIRTETIDFFFSSGLDLNALNYRGRTILHHACMRGNLVAVRHLVEMGCACQLDIADHDGKTPIDLAKDHNSLRVLNYLVEIRAAIPSNDESEIVEVQAPAHPAFVMERLRGSWARRTSLTSMYSFFLHTLLVPLFLGYLLQSHYLRKDQAVMASS